MVENKEEVVYNIGQYSVEVAADRYLIRNTQTKIVEHDTRILYEAIKYARILDATLKDVLNNTSKENVSWGRHTSNNNFH